MEGAAVVSWWDSIFGSKTPQPAHPQSRNPLHEAYPTMPYMTAPIEDRRGEHAMDPPGPPSATWAANQSILSRYPPGSHVYDHDQWEWLQAHMPQDRPAGPLLDPDATPDPSIVANIRAADARANEQGLRDIEALRRADLPSPMQPDPRRGPQISSAPGTTLNSNPWGY
jgi:hypothetical protein